MSVYALNWKADYATGVEEIDLQHRYFMELINRLSTELDGCVDEIYRKRLLNELVKYASFHFVSEENMMIKFAYPDIERHRMLHLDLIDKLSWQIQSKSYAALFEFLVDWFIRHTLEEDKHIGEFSNLSNLAHLSHSAPP
jgi:hemerythrin